MNKDKLSEYFPWVPPMESTKKNSILRWINRRLDSGAPIGCYGIYSWIVSQNRIEDLQKRISEKRAIAFVDSYGDRRSYNRWRMWCYRNDVGVPFDEWISCDVKQRPALKEKYAGTSPRKRKQKKKSEAAMRLEANLNKFRSLGLI